jgi:ABC-type polysaccharide/polyol phosphate export permease
VVQAQDVQALDAPLYERDSLLREAWNELRMLARFRELVRYLVSATLRKENANTALGSIWWLLDPLLLMIAFWLLVSVIFDRGGHAYPVFILSALLSWKFLSSSCGNAMNLTVGKARAMRQVRFPRAVLPLSAVIAGVVHFGFGIVVLVGAAVAFGIYPHPTLPLIVLVVLVQLTIVLGLAYVLSAINVFFRDVQNLTAYLFRIGFYLSPGLYSLERVPESWRPLYQLNPFTHIFTGYRDIVLEHRVPNLGALLVVGAVGLFVLMLGYLLFVRLEQSFTKVLV